MMTKVIIPLMIACENNSFSSIKYLVYLSININHHNNESETVLKEA